MFRTAKLLTDEMSVYQLPKKSDGTIQHLFYLRYPQPILDFFLVARYIYPRTYMAYIQGTHLHVGSPHRMSVGASRSDPSDAAKALGALIVTSFHEQRHIDSDLRL
jgi:hypothetical protein